MKINNTENEWDEVWDLADANLTNKEIISLLGERELTLDDIYDLADMIALSLEYDHEV